MGKYLTSLLILASSILLPDEIFADEQVRRVQEELRKRHLFYANPNGEKGPALSIAVRRYQQKKGFPATGVIDSVTLASLGISSPPVPSAATTPAVVVKRGQIHGANGERLPSYSPLMWPSERVTKFDPAIGDHEYLELALAEFRPGSRQRKTFGQRLGQTSVQDASAAGSPVPFDITSKRISEAMAQPLWNALVLPPPAEGTVESSVFDNERPRQAALRPNRRSQRRAPTARQRQERNPLVLTYKSLNRAIRSLFGETQTKKKRSTAKRL